MLGRCGAGLRDVERSEVGGELSGVEVSSGDGPVLRSELEVAVLGPVRQDPEDVAEVLLWILPHYSLAELDARLGGKPPAIVVVPNIPNIARVENKPLVEWMKRQAAAGSIMHSWCTGAMALAEAGLLDGLTATAHWGDLSRLAKLYPRVEWVRGVRWVDHGQVITSAGLTSGIDASLRVLTKFAGEDISRRVARELHYPNFHFSVDPVVTPYTVGPADAILPANLSFRVPRQQIGLAIYDGVGEMDLTGLYDAHIASADLHSIAAGSGSVRSAHGLILLPSLVASESEPAGSIDALRHLHRLVVPGRNGAEDGTRVVSALRTLAPALPAMYVHMEAGQRFGLEPVIEDLARTTDLPTARFALKRLEFRSETIRLEGKAIAWSTLPLALGLGVLGVLVALAVGSVFRLRGLWGYLPSAATRKRGGSAELRAGADLEKRASV